MNTEDVKKFLLSLVLFKEEFYKYTLDNNKIYKVNLNNEYDKIKNIYDEILKDKVFNETFDEYIIKFKKYIVDIKMFQIYLIEYDIIFF